VNSGAMRVSGCRHPECFASCAPLPTPGRSSGLSATRRCQVAHLAGRDPSLASRRAQAAPTSSPEVVQRARLAAQAGDGRRPRRRASSELS
jgi:hypothetical protein